MSTTTTLLRPASLCFAVVLALTAWRLGVPLELAAVVGAAGAQAALLRLGGRCVLTAHAVGEAWHLGWWYMATLLVA